MLICFRLTAGTDGIMNRPFYFPRFVSTECFTKVETRVADVDAPVIVLSGKGYFCFLAYLSLFVSFKSMVNHYAKH